MSSQSGQQIEIDKEACKRWLKFQATIIQSASKGSVLIKRNNSPSKEVDSYSLHWPENVDNTGHFHQVFSRAEKENKGVILSFQGQNSQEGEPGNTVHIAFPQTLGEHSTLIGAFELQPKDKQQLHMSMHQLEWGLMWLKEELTNKSETTSTKDMSSTVHELLESIQQQPRLMDAVKLLVDELSIFFNCHRVSIGRNQRDQISVLAVSHQATIEKTSPLVTDIAQAMEECSDQDTTVSFPSSAEHPGPITQQHHKLSSTHGASHIRSLPISHISGDENFVVLLEKEGPIGFEAYEQETLDRVCTSLSPILCNISLREQSLFTLTIKRIRQTLQHFSTNKASSLVKATIPLVIFLVIVLGKGDFRVKTDVTLTGTILRSVVAPFPGFVAEANKSAGDHVEQGESLAQLDTSDIILDELSWKSKFAQADLEYRKAIADNATSQAKIISQQKKQADIQLSLLGVKKQRAVIKAPFSGVIVKGDLSQSIGGPVEKGKLLFEMVPDGGYKIHAQVDEADISYIEEGQDGTLVFNSLPKDSYAFKVSKITPIATAKDGTNSFRVEADLQETSKRLNPGMTGYGKITVGRKPYVWLWTRTLRNKIRLLSWDLMP